MTEQKTVIFGPKHDPTPLGKIADKLSRAYSGTANTVVKCDCGGSFEQRHADMHKCNSWSKPAHRQGLAQRGKQSKETTKKGGKVPKKVDFEFLEKSANKIQRTASEAAQQLGKEITTLNQAPGPAEHKSYRSSHADVCDTGMELKAELNGVADAAHKLKAEIRKAAEGYGA
jgi:hypothetical protein